MIRPGSTRARSGHLRVLAAGVAFFTLGGCGYAFVGAGGLGKVAADREITVGTFDNRTTEADAGAVATRAATRALARAGAGTSATKPAARLEGSVESLGLVAAAPVRTQRVELWRVSATVHLALRDAHTNAVLAETSVGGAEEYRSGLDVEATEVARRLAVDRLLTRLVEEALARL